MPLYEFRCRECDHNWETRLEWKAPLPACPDCGTAEVRKVYHPAALVFKGSGWHVNDYGKNGAKSSITSNGGKPAGESTTGTAQSETTTTPPTTDSAPAKPVPAAAPA